MSCNQREGRGHFGGGRKTLVWQKWQPSAAVLPGWFQDGAGGEEHDGGEEPPPHSIGSGAYMFRAGLKPVIEGSTFSTIHHADVPSHSSQTNRQSAPLMTHEFTTDHHGLGLRTLVKSS